MTSDAELLESNALRNLRLASEERGFKFHIHPSLDLIPSFLAGYRPDAIAIGPDGRGIVIEVKRHRNRETDRNLAALAKRVATQKGWEFRAIYTNPATEAPAYIAKPTSEQVDATLKEIEALVEAAHYAPALIAGWAVLESLARLASADHESGHSGSFSPVQAIQTLAGEGYLENEAAQALREMAKLRNAVVHGDLSVQVSAEQVTILLKQLRALASDINSVMSEQNTE
ncbi:MAG: hypothetical protein EXR07_09865 [Acetobacteraceae bacterium]|nr:hypothetical protein [Acetobacteraceae bacterium]